MGDFVTSGTKTEVPITLALDRKEMRRAQLIQLKEDHRTSFKIKYTAPRLYYLYAVTVFLY